MIYDGKRNYHKVYELAIPTWTLAREEIQTGKIEEAFDLIDYGCSESEKMHDAAISIIDHSLSHLASFNEKEIFVLFRKIFYPRVKNWISTTKTIEDTIQTFAEYQRGHFSNFTITGEEDRYVITCDPCGSGGRLRRIRHASTTKKAYTWSWSQKGIPYYCTHCCIAWEIIATELQGFPIRIHVITDKPEDPCIQFVYKRPELIPEDYFARIGMAKTMK